MTSDALLGALLWIVLFLGMSQVAVVALVLHLLVQAGRHRRFVNRRADEAIGAAEDAAAEAASVMGLAAGLEAAHEQAWRSVSELRAGFAALAAEVAGLAASYPPDVTAWVERSRMAVSLAWSRGEDPRVAAARLVLDEAWTVREYSRLDMLAAAAPVAREHPVNCGQCMAPTWNPGGYCDLCVNGRAWPVARGGRHAHQDRSGVPEGAGVAAGPAGDGSDALPDGTDAAMPGVSSVVEWPEQAVELGPRPVDPRVLRSPQIIYGAETLERLAREESDGGR